MSLLFPLLLMYGPGTAFVLASGTGANTTSPARPSLLRYLGAVAAVGSILASPFFAPNRPISALFAFASAYVSTRMLQLFSEECSGFSGVKQFLHIYFFLHDGRQVTKGTLRPTTVLLLFLRAGLWALLASLLAGSLTSLQPTRPWGQGGLWKQWRAWISFSTACGLQLMAVLRALCCGFRAAFGLMAFKLPRIMHEPEKSQSLRDFWGRRWNRMVADTLKRELYGRLAGCGFGFATSSTLTFAASAALHCYPLLVACAVHADDLLGRCIGRCFSVCLFFVVHAILLLVERGVGVSRKRFEACAHVSVLRSTWVAVCLFATAPLVVVPFCFEFMGMEGSDSNPGLILHAPRSNS